MSMILGDRQLEMMMRDDDGLNAKTVCVCGVDEGVIHQEKIQEVCGVGVNHKKDICVPLA